MICPRCGSKFEHFSRFCSTCGAEQVPGNSDPDGALRTTQMERPEIRVPRWRLSKMEGVKIPDGFPLRASNRIGRDPRCEIVLPSPNISRFHAQIDWADTGFQISDLGSTNGTYVNRRLIKEPTRLKIGATVQVGEYTFLVMKDSTICSNCGETVRSDDRFCQFCGNSLIAPELQPRRETGVLTIEEPFPETTPVPLADEVSGGLMTPKYNTPPFIPGAERPAVQEKPASPPTPPPVRRSSIAPPPPPAPPSAAVTSVAVPEDEAGAGSRNAIWGTCLIFLAVGLCGLAALAAYAYYLSTTG